MAFDKETLQKLGLNEEQIQGVMAERGKELNKQKEKLTEVETEANSLREQLQEREKDINSLKKNNADNEELTKQLDEIKTKYKEAETQREAEIQQFKLNSAVDAQLAGINARDADVVKRLVDMDKVKLGDDGKVEGLDDQIKQLQTDKAFLFEGTQKTDYMPSGGDGATSANIAEALKSKDINLTEALKKNTEG